MHESIERLSNLLAEFDRERRNLTHIIEKVTDGKLSVCNGVVDQRIQLFNATTHEECLRIITEWADDACIKARWENDDSICYNFNIDKQPFCIIIDKEVHNNGKTN